MLFYRRKDLLIYFRLVFSTLDFNIISDDLLVILNFK